MSAGFVRYILDGRIGSRPFERLNLTNVSVQRLTASLFGVYSQSHTETPTGSIRSH